jgi:hypothetical protein
MTVILGTAAFIRAILDDIRASASTTGLGNGCLNHGISIRHHLLSNHYRRLKHSHQPVVTVELIALEENVVAILENCAAIGLI